MVGVGVVAIGMLMVMLEEEDVGLGIGILMLEEVGEDAGIGMSILGDASVVAEALLELTGARCGRSSGDRKSEALLVSCRSPK